MPFFSVIIPTYNRYDMLKRAIDSVLKQTYNDFELIIIDDGSTDETPFIETECKGKLVYAGQKNRGVSSARNAGIKISQSPYIAFLDSDDTWFPEKLSEQHRYILNNPETHLHQTEEIWIRKEKFVNQMNKHKKPEGDIFEKSLEMCMISPSSVVLHRGLFDKYGLFDEDMQVCEDYDLWLRITCYEKTGLIGKKLITKFGGHDSQLSFKYWGMDSFRIYSIIKLLKTNLKSEKPEYYHLARKTALKKCEIMLNGAIKRKNLILTEYINKIIRDLESEDYTRTNYSILLKK